MRRLVDLCTEWAAAYDLADADSMLSIELAISEEVRPFEMTVVRIGSGRTVGVFRVKDSTYVGNWVREVTG